LKERKILEIVDTCMTLALVAPSTKPKWL
jgi:hypothetical protein